MSILIELNCKIGTKLLSPAKSKAFLGMGMLMSREYLKAKHLGRDQD